MQVLDIRYPEGQDLAALQAYQAGLQQGSDQATAEWPEVNQPLTGVMADTQIRVSGAYVDMRFEQNGGAYKARVCCVIARATTTTSFPASQYLGAYSEVGSYWDTPLFYYTYHDGNGGFIQSNDPIASLSEASDLGAMGGG
jgi:hypothetical protein